MHETTPSDPPQTTPSGTLHDPSGTAGSRTAGRWRWATLVAGWSFVVIGTALLVLPGPGVPLLLGGLALLGREQAWARRVHARIEHELRTRIGRAGSWFRFRRQPGSS